MRSEITVSGAVSKVTAPPYGHITVLLLAAAPTGAIADGWGAPANGLQIRAVALSPDADDEAPDLSKPVNKFARAGDLTIAVELKNVSRTPVKLLGVRYGESYAPPAPGKLNASAFGPYLFDFDFTDTDGKSIDRAARAPIGSLLMHSGMSVHAVDPEKSLVVLLRPASFSSAMEYRLSPGSYRLRVRYRGPTAAQLAEIQKHWPNKPQASAWSGEVVAGEIALTIADDPLAKRSQLVWGEPREGLRAAVELVTPESPRRATRNAAAPPAVGPAGIPLGSKADVRLHVQNVSERTISFVSETWRQDDRITVIDTAGIERVLDGTWYSGWPILVRWTLQPGQIAELAAANIGIAANEDAAKKFEHPIGKTLLAEPGRYSVRVGLRMGGIQQKDQAGEVVVPGKQDWQGELVTGTTPIVLRLRTAADDAAEREPTMLGRITFVDPDGRPIPFGTYEVRVADRRDPIIKGEFRQPLIEIVDCPMKPLIVRVRAHGFEEALVYDVKLTAGETKRIPLTRAAATRFRLVWSNGARVAGAKVRFFNKTSGKATAGPFPMDGLLGPVWATSTADGEVVLDVLQRVDPHYAELGDAVYHFYVEPRELAPRMIGPVKAGQDLGAVQLGSYLEVRGEIHGTPEELDRFAAEWDQPFKLVSDNPAAAWLYAVSQRLETQRQDGKLTFHLTGLRPGLLRIISNFGPHPHSVSHTYGRRDPAKDDVVFETDLTQSRSDIVIQPSGADRASRDDAARVQGSWAVVESQFPPPIGKMPRFTIQFAGDRLNWRYDTGDGHEWQYHLNASTSPKQIDFRGEVETRDGTKQTQRRLGIYSLDGDTLRICYDTVEPVEEIRRPTDFSAEERSGRILLVLRRSATATNRAPADSLPGRLFASAVVRTPPDSSRIAHLAIAIDPNSGKWSRLQPLGGNSGGVAFPMTPIRVSHDARKMLFVKDGETWLCDTETGERMTRALPNGIPAAWSPDGSEFIAIAPTNDQDGWAVENRRVKLNTWKHAALSLPKATVVEDWSPDGKWLALVSRKDGQLSIAKPDGSEPRVLAAVPNAISAHPRFSPDSRRIIYQRYLDSRFSLRIVNVDGTNDFELLCDRPIFASSHPTKDKGSQSPTPTGFVSPMGARWSPDGRLIAVTLTDRSADGGILAISGNWRVVFIDPEGGKGRDLVSLENAVIMTLPNDGIEWRAAR